MCRPQAPPQQRKPSLFGGLFGGLSQPSVQVEEGTSKVGVEPPQEKPSSSAADADRQRRADAEQQRRAEAQAKQREDAAKAQQAREQQQQQVRWAEADWGGMLVLGWFGVACSSCAHLMTSVEKRQVFDGVPAPKLPVRRGHSW